MRKWVITAVDLKYLFQIIDADDIQTMSDKEIEHRISRALEFESEVTDYNDGDDYDEDEFEENELEVFGTDEENEAEVFGTDVEDPKEFYGLNEDE
jgi:hypothetical protein